MRSKPPSLRRPLLPEWPTSLNLDTSQSKTRMLSRSSTRPSAMPETYRLNESESRPRSSAVRLRALGARTKEVWIGPWSYTR